MKPALPDAVSRRDEILLRESTKLMRKGALVLVVSFLGVVVATTSLQVSGESAALLRIPRDVCAFSAVIFAGIFLLARRERLAPAAQYLVALALLAVPSSVFVTAHWLQPSGTTVYITGPMSNLYLCVIVVTGFFYDAVLSTVVGVLSAVLFLAAFFVDRAHFQGLTHADPMLIEGLTQPGGYVGRALMMVFTGVAVGFLATHAKSLIGTIVQEEHDRRVLDRLFGEYVSANVKDKLLGEGADSLAEKKTLTIMFSDIRSYSTISEQRPPETMVQQLNQYLDRMVAAIQAEGGVVDKFIGDAIMATFGGLRELPAPCEAAVRAAVGMQRELARLNDQWKAAGFPPFTIGIGIHHGEVLQGSIGSENRRDFTVIGDAVNTSSRLESLTKEHPYPILVSEDVHSRMDPARHVSAVDLGIVQVKGKHIGVRVFGIPLATD